jgi:hypothetical protein
MLNVYSDYEVFFKLLDTALINAEVEHGFPKKAVRAVWRLIRIARGGNTGFVNGVDVPSEVNAYVKWVYEANEAPEARPEFLRFYQDVL